MISKEWRERLVRLIKFYDKHCSVGPTELKSIFKPKQDQLFILVLVQQLNQTVLTVFFVFTLGKISIEYVFNIPAALSAV